MPESYLHAITLLFFIKFYLKNVYAQKPLEL